MAHTATTNPSAQDLAGPAPARAAAAAAAIDVASAMDAAAASAGPADNVGLVSGPTGTNVTGAGDPNAGAPGALAPASAPPPAMATASGGGSGGADHAAPNTHGNLTTTDPMRRGGEASAHKVSDEMLIKKIVNQAVQDTIQDEGYSHDATRLWSNRIVESLVRTLVQMDRDNKYIVTCMIVQNLRQGMRSATSCFWNAQTDSGYSLTNERNGMYVITTVFICKA